MTTAPLRLRLDGAALADNWRMLDRMSGRAACGAAVKADGYGLGAVGVVERLAAAGCCDFFVATWAEAMEIAPLGVTISVLHGVREADMATALASSNARPVLNTLAQVARWRAAGGGRCDVMVDTGMNRLGLSVADVAGGAVAGLQVETLMSHLACADEDDAMNARQLAAFASLKGVTDARRMSLANSAGIALGPDYHFDLTRPGLGLYGGVARSGLAGIRQVATPQAQIVQRRRVPMGETVGYNATYRATHDIDVAILNIGYADGYFRGFSGCGTVSAGGERLPLLGRVSMDLIAVDASSVPALGEGDWVDIAFALPIASAVSGMSQYELLTGLGRRIDRYWV